jgi:acetylornithine deacetylase/succinyl-diaminopimelate desuccinylase-like protein
LKDFIESCRKFIELDSTPSNGTAEIAEYAAELCREAGLFVDLQSEMLNGVQQTTVIARPSQQRPPQEFLLQTHLDTSDPGAYGLWTKTGANPFNASIYSDPSLGSEILYGLGSADTKLDFLCKLQAIIELQSQMQSQIQSQLRGNMNGSAWKLPPVLVGTFGEETGMNGAIKLIRKKLISAKMALVGEPTNMALIGAGKGFAAVEIEVPFSVEEKELRAEHDVSDASTTQSRMFVGKAAHSSAPQFGESAILKMIDYLTKLPESLVMMEMEGGVNFNTVPSHAVLEIDMVANVKETIGPKITRMMKAINDVEKQFLNYPDPAFEPAIPTMNIGVVRTYEDFVKFSGCCRLPPTVSNEVYEKWMELLKSACADVGGVFRITEYKQPFRSDLASPFVEVCQSELAKLGLPSGCGAQSVANEANVFSRFGIPCVVLGPGQGVGNSHAPNEHVRIEQLHQAVQFYRGVLERVSL